MKEYLVRSTEQTEALGRAIGQAALASGRRRLFFALFGEMGVGKTAFTRGIAAAVSPSSQVRSPTYTVVNEYRGGTFPIFHFDMYRIEGGDDLASVGYTDYIAKEGYIVCEWSENILDELPTDALFITIERTASETERKITVKGDGYEDIMP